MSAAAEVRAQLRLTAPIAGTQLGEIAIHTTDIVMLGRLGPGALAAGTLGVHVIMALMLFGFGVVMAVQPLVAQAKGARDPRMMRRDLRAGLWAGMIASLPLMLLCATGETLLRSAGQAPVIAQDGGAYLQAALWGIPGAVAFMALRGYVAAVGRPGLAMAVMLISVAVNAVLNYALIFGKLGAPRLELTGAGLASSSVNLAMAVALAVVIRVHPRLRRLPVFARFWRLDVARLRAVAAVGVPIGLTLVCEDGIFIAATIMMGWLGETALAAHGIAIQIVSVVFMLPLAIGLGATVRVGRYHGAGDPTGVRRAGLVAYALGGIVMLGAIVAFLTVPRTLIGLFVDLDARGNAEVIALATHLLIMAAVFQFADGGQVIGISALRGLSDTRVPFVFALVAYWVFGVATAYVLGIRLGLGGTGVWAGLAVGLAIAAVLFAARFHALTRDGRTAWRPASPRTPHPRTR
jgi:MATE family multidrug resistance protein